MTTPGALRASLPKLYGSRRFWLPNLTVSLVEPLLYMLGLGVGVGALVDRNSASTAALAGVSYVAYVAPGLMASTVMTICAMESLWPVVGGLHWDRAYHALAGTPLDAADIVGGHAIWCAVRGVVAAGSIAAVLALFDATRSSGLPLAAVVGVLVGLAFAMPAMAFSVGVGAGDTGVFAGVQRFVLIPLFLFGGAFYPLSQLPPAVGWIARAFPLWHGVVVARGFTTHRVDWPAAAGHLAYIGLWIVLGAIIAARRLRSRLYP